MNDPKATSLPEGYISRPAPQDRRLTERVTGIDQTGARIDPAVTVQRPLTIYLNSQEIVTAMTIPRTVSSD